MQLSPTIAFAISALLLVPEAYGLGINCRGSGLCPQAGLDAPNAAIRLKGFIDNIQNDRFYRNGEQIACVHANTYDGICAFWQKTNGLYGGTAKQKAHYIPEHGCDICGSVPLDYPHTNNVENGMLTFNYVTKTCLVGTDGLCP